ncbi:hypothetical protein KI387_005682, partial [Taxus chinensis]
GEWYAIGVSSNGSELNEPYGREAVMNSKFEHHFNDLGGPVSSCFSSGMSHSHIGGSGVKDGRRLVDDMEG